MTAPLARGWQQAEGALVLAAGLTLFRLQEAGIGWWAVALFFAPDLSFAAYALGNRAGAAVYNLVHLYGLGALLLVLGLVLPLPWLAGLGSLWMAHVGFDRMLGYGLKSPDGFGVTHLGRIGR